VPACLLSKDAGGVYSTDSAGMQKCKTHAHSTRAIHQEVDFCTTKIYQLRISNSTHTHQAKNYVSVLLQHNITPSNHSIIQATVVSSRKCCLEVVVSKQPAIDGHAV
jgi:hypothetical protein